MHSKEYCYWIALGVFSAQLAWADDDAFHLNASVNEIWDSNFSRSPDADEEKITLASAGARFNQTYGRQRFFARWQVNRFTFAEHEDFNATAQSGELGWNGVIGSRINTEVALKRDDYLVDRLEFFGKDVVSRDDLTAKLGYGNEGLLSFHVGGIESRQTHSNWERSGLDFDEHQAFVDGGYESRNHSSIYVRVLSGNREYTYPVDDRNLDFDFRQLELEAVWAISPKTKISGRVAGFDRTGEVNSASGSIASFDASWQATDKVLVEAGYSLNHPAIGETSDSPAKVQQSSLSLMWQYSPKISVGSSARYSKLDYDATGSVVARQETLYDTSPITIKYQPHEHLLLQLHAGWRKNESPLYFRNYTSRQIMVGLTFNY